MKRFKKKVIKKLIFKIYQNYFSHLKVRNTKQNKNKKIIDFFRRYCNKTMDREI